MRETETATREMKRLVDAGHRDRARVFAGRIARSRAMITRIERVGDNLHKLSIHLRTASVLSNEQDVVMDVVRVVGGITRSTSLVGTTQLMNELEVQMERISEHITIMDDAMEDVTTDEKDVDDILNPYVDAARIAHEDAMDRTLGTTVVIVPDRVNSPRPEVMDEKENKA